MYKLLRLAAGVSKTQLGQPEKNGEAIAKLLQAMEDEGVDLALFPELSLTGASLGDLFHQTYLLEQSAQALDQLLKATSDLALACVIGLPVRDQGRIYDALALIQQGQLLALLPRTHFADRTGSPFARPTSWVGAGPLTGPLGPAGGQLGSGGLLARPLGPAGLPWAVTPVLTLPLDQGEARLSLAFAEDLKDPARRQALAASGADILLLADATPLRAGEWDTKREDLQALSRQGLGLVYACQGAGESTTDHFYPGRRLILEAGDVLAESALRDRAGWLSADLDLERIWADRARKGVLAANSTSVMGSRTPASALGWAGPALPASPTAPIRLGNRRPSPAPQAGQPLRRPIDPQPFLPKDAAGLEEVLTLQTLGLTQRMEAIGVQDLWLGLSGGLDSTLALLVLLRAFEALGLDRQGIHALSLPAYGTSDRTRHNAADLAQQVGIDFREIRLEPALQAHFADIGLAEGDRSTAFENAQARERTQILMDLANKEGGLVVGTGDLSEIALGWCTYNGDQMSMYNVNASIPKTLVKALVAYEGQRLAAEDPAGQALQALLADVLATPISPELLPPEAGAEIQDTEAILGSYDLHDFFLYQVLTYGFPPAKIAAMARQAFGDRFSEGEILTSLRTFYRRFFSSQFKRSASPDGLEAVRSLSPRGAWQMPSDLSAAPYLAAVDALLAALPPEARDSEERGEQKGEDGIQ